MAYTPENNPYIPGDPYSYDLKWVVDKINDWDSTKEAADQAVSIAQGAADNAYTSANKAEAWATGYYEGEPVESGEPQYENNAKYYAEQAAGSAEDAAASAEDAAASAEEVAGIAAPITQALNTQGQQISALEGRMDTFASLPEGSTTGDAELQDIRVAADGTVYPTAGDAVRGQVNILNDLINLETVSYDYELVDGGINGSGAVFGVGDGRYRHFEDFYPTLSAANMIFNDKNASYVGQYSLFCCYYDSNQAFVRRDTTEAGYTIDTTQAYFKLSFYDAVAADESKFRSWITWQYPNNTKTAIDSLTAKVDNILYDTLSKSGNTITINTPKAQYTFERITNASINIDTWRLYAGYLKTSGQPFNMWIGSDAEGVIKLAGESDFIGGFHGDEILSDIKIIMDGKELDLTEDYSNIEFSVLEIYVKSTVYHVDSTTPAFSRNKLLIFENDTVKIANCFTALENVLVQQAPLALFQCYKYNSSNEEILHSYSVNTDYANYDINNTDVYPANSRYLNAAILNTEYGSIEFKLTQLDPDFSQYYLSDVSIGTLIAQNRLKIYFNTITNTPAGVPIAAGGLIFSAFEWSIK